MIHFYTSAKSVKSFHTGFSGNGGGGFLVPGNPHPGRDDSPPGYLIQSNNQGVPVTGELGFHGAGPGDVTLYACSLRAPGASLVGNRDRKRE